MVKGIAKSMRRESKLWVKESHTSGAEAKMTTSAISTANFTEKGTLRCAVIAHAMVMPVEPELNTIAEAIAGIPVATSNSKNQSSPRIIGNERVTNRPRR